MNSQKIAEELITANHKLSVQNMEIALRAAELILANEELKFQFTEKENRAFELVIANKKLIDQNEEKEKSAKELLVANTELAFQNEEKEKRVNELAAAILALAVQDKEKEKSALELIAINTELKKAEAYQKEYIKGLEEMIHVISHEVRHPICQIIGVSNLVCNKSSKDEINTVIGFIKKSANSLDLLTSDLSKLISKLKNKGLAGKMNNQNSSITLN